MIRIDNDVKEKKKEEKNLSNRSGNRQHRRYRP
jgi:hypothetical protein